MGPLNDWIGLYFSSAFSLKWAVWSKAVDLLYNIELDITIICDAGNELISYPDNV